MSAAGSWWIDRATAPAPNVHAGTRALGEVDSGIQVAIQQVHDDVDADEEDRDDKNGALHQRVVALEDRSEEHPADARDGEDLLDDDRPAQQLTDLDAEQRDDHDEPVLEHMPPHHETWCQALC